MKGAGESMKTAPYSSGHLCFGKIKLKHVSPVEGGETPGCPAQKNEK